MAWTLIATLLAGALPMLSGIVLIADPTPAYTLDICHPLTACSFSLDQSAAPLVPAQLTAPALVILKFIYEYALPFSPRPNPAPDPPPPRNGV
jgi:hypothetical protein